MVLPKFAPDPPRELTALLQTFYSWIVNRREERVGGKGREGERKAGKGKGNSKGFTPNDGVK